MDAQSRQTRLKSWDGQAHGGHWGSKVQTSGDLGPGVLDARHVGHVEQPVQKAYRTESGELAWSRRATPSSEFNFLIVCS